MKFVRENGVNMITQENGEDLREVIGGLLKIKIKSQMVTVYNLRWESREVVEIIKEVAEELIDIDQHDIEFKDCQKSLRHLLDRAINGKFISNEILKIIYFVFEFSLTSIIIDEEPVLEMVYDDNRLSSLAFGISTIAEGVLDGTEMVLNNYDESEDDEGEEKELEHTNS